MNPLTPIDPSVLDASIASLEPETFTCANPECLQPVQPVENKWDQRECPTCDGTGVLDYCMDCTRPTRIESGYDEDGLPYEVERWADE